MNRMPELQTAPGRQVSAMGRGGDVAVALAVVDVMDVVDVDLTAAADVEAVAMTVVDVVTASQAQPLSALRPALNKTPLTACSQTLYTVMSLATGSLLMTTHTEI